MQRQSENKNTTLNCDITVCHLFQTEFFWLVALLLLRYLLRSLEVRTEDNKDKRRGRRSEWRWQEEHQQRGSTRGHTSIWMRLDFKMSKVLYLLTLFVCNLLYNWVRYTVTSRYNSNRTRWLHVAKGILSHLAKEKSLFSSTTTSSLSLNER